MISDKSVHNTFRIHTILSTKPNRDFFFFYNYLPKLYFGAANSWLGPLGYDPSKKLNCLWGPALRGHRSCVSGHLSIFIIRDCIGLTAIQIPTNSYEWKAPDNCKYKQSDIEVDLNTYLDWSICTSFTFNEYSNMYVNLCAVIKGLK